MNNFIGHEGAVICSSFTADGNFVATGLIVLSEFGVQSHGKLLNAYIQKY